MNKLASKKQAIVCFAILLYFATLLFIHIKLFFYAEDDAYIHFRIADNLAKTGYPYFNSGEPVMASSSTIWTILLAGISLVTSNLPLAVAILNPVLVGVGGLVYAQYAYHMNGRAIAWLIPIVYAGVLIKSSVGLMETPLAMLVLGYALLLFQKKAPAAFLFFGLAVFLRVELAAFLVIFTLAGLFYYRYSWKPVILNIIFGITPFLLYDLLYFKTIVPFAVYAKSVVFTLTPLNWFLSFVGMLPSVWESTNSFHYWKIAYFTILICLTGLTLLFILRKWRPRSGPYLINYLVMIGGFAIIAAYLRGYSLIFSWYVPLYLFPILLSMLIVYGSNKLNPGIGFVTVLSLPFVLHFLLSFNAATINPDRFELFLPGARARQYLEVSKQLYREYPKASLMTSEIGAVGYGFRGQIYDGAGLVSPPALIYHPMKIPDERPNGIVGAIPAGYVKMIQPDIVIGLDVFVDAVQKSGALADYVWIKQPFFLPEDQARYKQELYFDNRYLNIFIKKEIYKP